MRRAAAVCAVPTLLLALLAGCSQVEDAASGAADAAGDRAKKEASDAVSSAVRGQICALVSDGQLSDADIKSLSRVLDRAHDSGLPDELLDPAHDIVSEGEASAAKVSEIRRNCE
jgi:hypothetical protein